MPKPFYPAQGGVRRALWTLSKPAETPQSDNSALIASPSRREKELEAENARLKAELEQLRRELPSPIIISNTHTANAFVWIALGACALCILFTFATFLRR